MSLKVPVAELVKRAEAEITFVKPADAWEQVLAGEATMVDLRDVRELWRNGKALGALHAPRGMLEFWVDPDSPYHKPEFATGKTYILYCAAAWRSALATKQLQDMGFGPVAHLDGGMTAWIEAGLPTEPLEKP
jgi:rhodanese-related sulfurtransferase